jgi:membrane-bound metal-dependent hydrolase YbcI (DUF457 family)
MPFWAALFIGNIASEVLLDWLVPWRCAVLAWWLDPPREEPPLANLMGTSLLIALYAVSLTIFCLNSKRR